MYFMDDVELNVHFILKGNILLRVVVRVMISCQTLVCVQEVGCESENEWLTLAVVFI